MQYYYKNLYSNNNTYNNNTYNNAYSKGRVNSSKNNIDFFLIDSYENIRKIKDDRFSKYPNYSEIIFVNLHKGEYKEKEMYYVYNFINSYYFITIENQEHTGASIGLLLPRNKNNESFDIKNKVFNILKKSKFTEEMTKKLKIDLIKDNFELKNINYNHNNKNYINYKYSIIKRNRIENKDNNTLLIDKIINNNNSNNNNFNNSTPQGNYIYNNSQLNNNYQNSDNYQNYKNNGNNNVNHNEYQHLPNQNNIQNNGYNMNNSQINSNNNSQNPPQNSKYIFPEKGLNNIGSTCYMNATLQCLLHVSELISYFLNEYPNDRSTLRKKNKYETGGEISEAFYGLVNGICKTNNNNDLNQLNRNTTISKHRRNNSDYNYNNYISYSSDSISPYNFKSKLGIYNPQFQKFEANDSKDLILYLLQTMHEELNYFGDINTRYNNRVNQFDRAMTFNVFINNYNSHNFSIISNLFYGTYENTTKCDMCRNIIFNFQKFEFISFGMYNYNGKSFNIYDGFRDNETPQRLRGDNQFYCSYCKKLVDAEITCKIIQPPNKLLINIDYGKNKKYKPSSIRFDEIIDITKFVNFNFGCPIKYRIICVCTHLGYSGSYGHYIAYCRHRHSTQWYNFNDSSVNKCSKNDIYGGSPYLLLYEKI